jgi:ABC-type glucose/galactose transport system permease subunit
VGLINGSLVAKAHIPPFIATLGTFTAIRGAANLYTGGRPISNLTDDYNFIGQGDVFGAPVPIIILVVMAVVTHILYAHTKFGKYIYAIGGNEQAARVSGINAARYKMLIYGMPLSWQDWPVWWFRPGLVQGNRGLALAMNLMLSRPRSSVAPPFRQVGSGQLQERLSVR